MKYKRATVYFSPDIHKALRLRAAESGSSISQIVNAALQQALLDDAADLDSFLLHQQWVAARPLSHRLSR
jgi:hypothetical protein